ncbi:hypothetical protein BFW01_g2528 [Lasiodiplodia theobromae]|uniref:Uncharacterized protein n=1 Tax=Lasiodiplodia theobromae TaxID=45133 RepID=A0A5N5DG85_9PEZI|nr:uncharacterized protein LTHEOB_5422 [Lasiodiplodia theobromae]KAB2575984.1 hypothetical protein DBV05_g5353 [Lasiodiplodia theobromae]KAF4545011.1 hypothetical protein LTHEOB_5422 [Lasiodiplodia theobromae]KAF9631666.1 hypothetical protein BFW01_g2528 [Lasiodiplodia theobromae]
MCVAELNVSNLPCRHRWYHLLRPCSPTTNLSNCPNKLGIEGWETKCDFCPYCAAWNLSNTDFRLVGNDRSPSVGGLSRSPSANYGSTTTLTSARRDSRRASLARTDSTSSIPALGLSVVEKTGEKNRAINSRLDAYLGKHPERKYSNSDGDTTDGEESRSLRGSLHGSLHGSVHGRCPSTDGSDIMTKVDAQIASGNLNAGVGKKDKGFFKKIGKSSKRLSKGIFK